MAAKDAINFFGKYLRNPRFTGAVCPSSRFLSKKMADGGKAPKGGIVLELGPGTGPVTEYILKGGTAPQDLFCIEFDPGLAAGLKARYPEVNVINGSAEDMAEYLGPRKTELRSIISSLPLLSLPESVVREVIYEAETLLPSGGRFVQFTYNLNRKPVSLGFTKMRHVKKSIVLANVPPARVDVFEKL